MGARNGSYIGGLVDAPVSVHHYRQLGHINLQIHGRHTSFHRCTVGTCIGLQVPTLVCWCTLTFEQLYDRCTCTDLSMTATPCATCTHISVRMFDRFSRRCTTVRLVAAPVYTVQVYSSADFNNSEILRACSNALPRPNVIRSFSNQLFVRMRSDGSVAKKGFKATYVTG